MNKLSGCLMFVVFNSFYFNFGEVRVRKCCMSCKSCRPKDAGRILETGIKEVTITKEKREKYYLGGKEVGFDEIFKMMEFVKKGEDTDGGKAKKEEYKKILETVETKEVTVNTLTPTLNLSPEEIKSITKSGSGTEIKERDLEAGSRNDIVKSYEKIAKEHPGLEETIKSVYNSALEVADKIIEENKAYSHLTAKDGEFLFKHNQNVVAGNLQNFLKSVLFEKHEGSCWQEDCINKVDDATKVNDLQVEYSGSGIIDNIKFKQDTTDSIMGTYKHNVTNKFKVIKNEDDEFIVHVDSDAICQREGILASLFKCASFSPDVFTDTVYCCKYDKSQNRTVFVVFSLFHYKFQAIASGVDRVSSGRISKLIETQADLRLKNIVGKDLSRRILAESKNLCQQQVQRNNELKEFLQTLKNPK